MNNVLRKPRYLLCPGHLLFDHFKTGLVGEFP